MKKNVKGVLFFSLFLGLFLTLFLIMVSIPLVSSTANIALTKESYYPGETLQVEISGDFTNNLKSEDIGIYSDSVHKIPVQSGFLKEGDKYLFYAILPEVIGDYSVKIEKTSDLIVKNFTITATNESYLSFDKGFIFTANDFSLKIKAYNQEQTVNVEFAPTNFKKTFELGYGSEKTVYFSISGIENFTKSEIKINSYDIPTSISPVYVPIRQNKTADNYSIEELLSLSPEEINATILADSDYYFKITLFNNFDDPLEDIFISTENDEIKISPESIDELITRKTINVTINAEDSFEGSIIISYKNTSLEIPVSVVITKSNSEVNYNTVPINEEKTCSGLGGKICKENEKCSLITYATDGICCKSECEVSSSSKAWLYGLLILIILAIAGYFIYKKQKQSPKEKSSDILKRKSEEYRDRLNPKNDFPEVRKSLARD